MINNITRNGTKVVLEIDTKLSINGSVLLFDWQCVSEICAELLKNHLLTRERESREGIAKECLMYLTKKERSELKSKLKDWNGKDHCWK